MKKILLVLCVLMMGSLFASATHYTVTANTFCDIWSVTLDKGYNYFTGLPLPTKVYVWGDHDLFTNCGLAHYETNGIKHGAGAKVPPNDIYGTAQAVLDVNDTEGGSTPVQFLLRVTNGCGLSAFIGGAAYGVPHSVFVNEDTCTLGASPTRTGLKPIVPRQ